MRLGVNSRLTTPRMRLCSFASFANIRCVQSSQSGPLSTPDS